jgi:hypothetical protein
MADDDDPVRALAKLHAHDRRDERHHHHEMARLRRQSSGSHLWRWLSLILAVLALAAVVGYIYSRHHQSTTALGNSSTPCQDYRKAIGVVLAVPRATSTPDVNAIRQLSRADQREISKRIVQFVSSAQQTGQRLYAAAEAEYNAQLVSGLHPSVVIPTPPRPLSSYIAGAAQAEVPSWQAWVVKAKAQMITENGC